MRVKICPKTLKICRSKAQNFAKSCHTGHDEKVAILSKNKRQKARISVTRLGNLLDYGKLFKAFGNNLFAQTFYILRQFM